MGTRAPVRRTIVVPETPGNPFRVAPQIEPGETPRTVPVPVTPKREPVPA